jgi:hypothetical protein
MKLDRRPPPERWTEEEDALLMEAVAKYGPRGRWREIAEALGPHKTGSVCYQHYFRVLDPSVCKERFTDEEVMLFVALVKRHGSHKWTKLTNLMSEVTGRKRTPTQMRSRWVDIQRHANEKARKCWDLLSTSVPMESLFAEGLPREMYEKLLTLEQERKLLPESAFDNEQQGADVRPDTSSKRARKEKKERKEKKKKERKNVKKTENKWSAAEEVTEEPMDGKMAKIAKVERAIDVRSCNVDVLLAVDETLDSEEEDSEYAAVDAAVATEDSDSSNVEPDKDSENEGSVSEDENEGNCDEDNDDRSVKIDKSELLGHNSTLLTPPRHNTVFAYSPMCASSSPAYTRTTHVSMSPPQLEYSSSMLSHSHSFAVEPNSSPFKQRTPSIVRHHRSASSTAAPAPAPPSNQTMLVYDFVEYWVAMLGQAQQRTMNTATMGTSAPLTGSSVGVPAPANVGTAFELQGSVEKRP